MRQYLDLLRTVLETGDTRKDRTGVGTKSIFGATMRFDLRDNFPAVTTKKLNFKPMAQELAWFLRGETNVKTLGNGIWNDWARPDGEIGPTYGSAWRRLYGPTKSLVLVNRRIATDNFVHPTQPMRERIDCDLNSDDCWAIEDLGAKSGNRRYRVQFKSGFITEMARPNWRLHESSDNVDGYHRSVSGTGFLGNPVGGTERHYNLWCNMISRCYNSNHPHYRTYGGAGVSVASEWHSYELFVKTISGVPGYHIWESGVPLELDKDYYGSSTYSPQTCIFLSVKDNVGMRTDGSCIEIQGVKYASYTEWCGDKKRAYYAKSKWDAGKSYGGIPASMVKVVRPPDGMLWRRKMVHDQVGDLVKSLRESPHGRRHIVSAWNVSDLPYMALPPCHVMFQCYVGGESDEFLDLQLYQRSLDAALGAPFNIASYSLLLSILAQQLGKTARYFIHTIGDAHIYLNHIDGIKEQLTREPLPLPRLVLDPGATVDNFHESMARLEDYRHHPAIRFEVAV